jgi:hypothetical protein
MTELTTGAAADLPERSPLERELTASLPGRRAYLRELTESADLGRTLETLITNAAQARNACDAWLRQWQAEHPGADIAQARRSSRFQNLRFYYLGTLDQLAAVLQLTYPPPDEQSRKAAPAWATVVLDRRQWATHPTPIPEGPR